MAQQTQRYTIEQFMDTSRVSAISFSHDETSILVSSNKTGIFNVFSVSIAGGTMKQLTFSTDDDIRAIAYFPNDSRIVYARDKGGIESRHLCVLEEDGRHVDLTDGTGIKAGLRRWSRDGKHFYCVTNERDRRYFDLYKIDSESYERTLLYECADDDVFIDVSNDERWGLFVRSNSTTDTDIYLYDFAENVMQNLTPHEDATRYHSPYFDLESQNVFYSTCDDEANTYVYRYELSSGKTDLARKNEGGCVGEHLSCNGRYRVILKGEGVRMRIAVYESSSGKEIMLPSFPEGDIKLLTISRSERLMAFYVNGDRAPNDLYVYEFATKQLRKLTNSLNPAINPADLVESEEITFKSFDGLEIPCLLWKPHDATADSKAPALVWVHGGPGGQTRKGYAAAVQFLVNHGYVVLGVNHRGSSGFDKAFEAAADRKQGREPLWDCVEAKRYLSNLGFVDQSKIAIIGGSFGAYMTLAALAFHPEEFAAGVAIAGVSNWIRALKSLSPTQSRKLYYEKVGDPDTDEEMLRAISPLFHATNIRKPLMVIQGAKDPRVSRVESEDIVAAVRSNGGTVEYLLLDDEAHGFRKRTSAVRAYQAVLDFLDRHLKNNESCDVDREKYALA